MNGLFETGDSITLKNNDVLIVVWGFDDSGKSMFKIHYMRKKKSVGELELEFGSHAIKEVEKK